MTALPELVVAKLVALVALAATSAAGAAALVVAAVGDATVGAVVGGAFGLLNTILLAFLTREQRRVHRTLRAPRTLVYDAQGRPIGTVLALDAGAGWQGDA